MMFYVITCMVWGLGFSFSEKGGELPTKNKACNLCVYKGPTTFFVKALLSFPLKSGRRLRAADSTGKNLGTNASGFRV